LSAALALLQRGFTVDVYEQAPRLEEVGAGVQLSPNGTRALDAMGVLDALETLSCTAERRAAAPKNAPLILPAGTRTCTG
jgi:salicylate hydroxylase